MTYQHMKSVADISAMSKLLLQNGYRANQQQHSTARPPGLYIRHPSFMCSYSKVCSTLVYSRCTISLFHTHRRCRSHGYLFLFLNGSQQG